MAKLPLCIPWIIFLYFGTRDLELPGLYMDEINHGAFAPAIMCEKAADKHHFRLPDNFIFNKFFHTSRFPILGGSVYNSCVTSYLAIPFYEIGGYTVKSHRLFVLFVAACILGLVQAISLNAVKPIWLANAVTCAFAIDPLFTFPLRSQANYFAIMLVPMLLLVWMASKPRVDNKVSALVAFLMGALITLSASIYFVAIALLAIPAIWLLWVMYKQGRIRWFLLGIGLSAIPYLYALGSIYLQNPQMLENFGVPGFAVDAQASRNAPIYRLIVDALAELLEYVLGSSAIAWTGLSEFRFGTLRLFAFVTILLLTVSALVLAFHHKHRISSATWSTFVMFLGPISGFISLLFLADAVTTHHCFSVLPFLYLSGGFACSVILKATTSYSRRGALTVAFAALWIGLLLSSAIQQQAVMLALRETGGRGLHNKVVSDIVDIYQTDFRAKPLVFADWGYHLTFLFLSRGTIPYQVEFAEPSVWVPSLVAEGPEFVVCCSINAVSEIVRQAESLDAKVSISIVRTRENLPAFAFLQLIFSTGGVK